MPWTPPGFFYTILQPAHHTCILANLSDPGGAFNNPRACLTLLAYRFKQEQSEQGKDTSTCARAEGPQHHRAPRPGRHALRCHSCAGPMRVPASSKGVRSQPISHSPTVQTSPPALCSKAGGCNLDASLRVCRPNFVRAPGQSVAAPPPVPIRPGMIGAGATMADLFKAKPVAGAAAAAAPSQPVSTGSLRPNALPPDGAAPSTQVLTAAHSAAQGLPLQLYGHQQSCSWSLDACCNTFQHSMQSKQKAILVLEMLVIRATLERRPRVEGGGGGGHCSVSRSISYSMMAMYAHAGRRS